MLVIKLRFYLLIAILWIIGSLIIMRLNFIHNNQPVITYYSNYFGFIVLNEFLVQICYFPESIDYIIIITSSIIWTGLMQISIFYDTIFSLDNFRNANVSSITFIIIFLISLIFYQMYSYPKTRFHVGLTIGMEILNICVLLVLNGIDNTIDIQIRNWQIFYFIALNFPEKKYHIIYCSLIGMILSELILYGLQMPYDIY